MLAVVFFSVIAISVLIAFLARSGLKNMSIGRLSGRRTIVPRVAALLPRRR